MIDVAYVEKGTDYQEHQNVFILRHLHNPLLSVCSALSRNILSLQNWVSVIVLRNYISTSTGHNVGAPLRRKVLFTTTQYWWYREHFGILFLSHISLPVNVDSRFSEFLLCSAQWVFSYILALLPVISDANMTNTAFHRRSSFVVPSEVVWLLPPCVWMVVWWYPTKTNLGLALACDWA